jgi:lipopolysaccharide transport system ATP-binding protein
MVVRLAFAVAINVDPEILIVDEALAVGDTYFRHRCMRKVHELRARGITIVFVSHSAADVKAIGDRVLWLEHGRAAGLGETDEILSRYLAAMSREPAADNVPAPAPIKAIESIPNIDRRHGDGRARILGIAILNEYGESVHLMMPGMRIVVRISVRAVETIARPEIGFVLRNHLGIDFAETNTAREAPLSAMRPGDVSSVDFHLDMPEFYPGAFSFSPFITDGDVCDWIDNAITVQMGKGEGPVYGYIQLPCRIEFNAPPARREASELESTIA